MTLLWGLLGLVAGLCGLNLWTRKIARTVEVQVPQAGQTHPVTGGRIHYVDLGPRDAPVLVLIHGLAGQLQHFSMAVTERLQDDFRLIVLDRPGNGYSTRDGALKAPLSEQARMIWQLLDEIGVHRPFFVGHSLGGALSLHLALDRPEATQGIALISPVTRPVTSVHAVFAGLAVRQAWLRAFIAHFLSGPVGRFTARKILDQAFLPDKQPAGFMTKGGALLGLRPQGFVAASEDLWMMPAAMQSLSERYMNPFPVPGGVLFGTHDPLLPAAEHGLPMEALGLSYETLDGLGHMLPMIAPDETADFIRRTYNAATGAGPGSATL